MGKFWDLEIDKLDKTAWCKQCDWECFRDPSELSGPLLGLTQQPFKTASRFLNDATYRKMWAKDVMYYRACDYFNARQAPNMKKLARFEN